MPMLHSWHMLLCPSYAFHTACKKFKDYGLNPVHVQTGRFSAGNATGFELDAV
jgi:hypothetical protein